jgi:hypothetical protein
MGDEARSAVALRWMIRATTGQNSPEDGESLRNMSVAQLPNGATCYVIENSSVYRYRRDSVLAVNGADVLAPLVGDGRWIRVSADDILNEAGAQVELTVTNTFATINSTSWFPPALSNFALKAGISGTTWTLGTLGQLTYNGQGGTFLVTAGWSMQNAADATPNLYTIGISLNNELNGVVQPETAGLMDMTVVQSAFFSLTTVRVVTLANGDILQPRARCITQSAISTLVLRHFAMAVAPMPSV